MRYPKLKTTPATDRTVDVFRGCNRTSRVSEGEFSNMENLTSGHFPVLAPRAPRSFYRKPASPQGLIAKDRLCYVDGASFVMGDTVIDMGLSVQAADCPKQLVSMGAYVIIWPDKMYINTKNPDDRGSLDAVFTTAGTVTVAGWGKAAGNYVQINHHDGFSSIYMHLSSIGVSAGQNVSAGQYIGATGSTGVSTGDHLHFGISLNGVYVNPCNYVPL